MLHIHFGPSPLALGLLVPASLRAGFEVALIGRPGSREPKQFGRTLTGPEGRLQWHTVEWFEGPSVLTDLPEELYERLAGSEPVLATFTLRTSIDECAAMVRELIELRRIGGGETVFIACENDPTEMYETLWEEARAAGVLTPSAVVNRMCLAAERDEGRRMVSVHPSGEWLIEALDPLPKVIVQLSTSSDVEAVTDVDARYKRKVWMVNGAHQALALAARRANWAHLIDLSTEPRERFARLDDAAVDHDVRTWLTHLHGGMNEALRVTCPELPGNIDYGLEQVRAYCQHPDGIERVLAAFQRARLWKFLKVLDDRVAAPARICAAKDLSLEAFTRVIDDLDALVPELLAFSDGEDVEQGRAPLTVEDDERSIAAYRALLGDWMASEEIDRRVDTFSKALASQRNQLL